MEIPIVYEDDQIIVINKPPGVVVNRAESVKGETVQDWMEAYLSFPRPPAGEAGRRESRTQTAGSPIPLQSKGLGMTKNDQDFYDRGGVVHRTDKETSGLLILAKNPTAFFPLQSQFKNRTIRKTYLALVHGKPPQEGEINAPIDRLPWNRERFGIVPGGKESMTRYKAIKSFQFTVNREQLTLVEVYPETGRTHQIRVHFKYLGYPLVGDYLYAGRKTSRNDRTWAPRVMLHAWKIEFTHPASGIHLAIEAEIPDDMKRIIQSDK